ncbi:MAG: phosphatidylglycerol lysyltransferase domain-containing protein [Bacteroidales bacterium]|nr:phosphatidylglycerol lysyltransferase domain-containing protein [Bacteroidales bacterium]
MIDFKEIELKDKEWADHLLTHSGYQGAEYCFTNLYIWDGIYKSKIGRYKDFLILRTGTEGDYHYLYPPGRGDKREIIDLLINEAESGDYPLSFIGLTRETREELNRLFPNKFRFTPVRDSFDYIYEVEKMISLTGKKLQPKRNHLNYFSTNYKWSYDVLTEKNIDEVLDFNHEWCIRADCSKYETLSWESCAVEKCLANYGRLNLIGGLLRVEGEVVAYTIGETLNTNTFIVHIEKAFPDVRGAYPMINREFLKRNATMFNYVNREDDIGDEGLRKAKESYYPIFMLEKFSAKLF